MAHTGKIEYKDELGFRDLGPIVKSANVSSIDITCGMRMMTKSEVDDAVLVLRAANTLNQDKKMGKYLAEPYVRLARSISGGKLDDDFYMAKGQIIALCDTVYKSTKDKNPDEKPEKEPEPKDEPAEPPEKKSEDKPPEPKKDEPEKCSEAPVDEDDDIIEIEDVPNPELEKKKKMFPHLYGDGRLNDDDDDFDFDDDVVDEEAARRQDITNQARSRMYDLLYKDPEYEKAWSDWREIMADIDSAERGPRHALILGENGNDSIIPMSDQPLFGTTPEFEDWKKNERDRAYKIVDEADSKNEQRISAEIEKLKALAESGALDEEGQEILRLFANPEARGYKLLDKNVMF